MGSELKNKRYLWWSKWKVLVVVKMKGTCGGQNKRYLWWSKWKVLVAILAFCRVWHKAVYWTNLVELVDSRLRGQSLSLVWVIVLCSWARHFTLAVISSTHTLYTIPECSQLDPTPSKALASILLWIAWFTLEAFEQTHKVRPKTPQDRLVKQFLWRIWIFNDHLQSLTLKTLFEASLFWREVMG